MQFYNISNRNHTKRYQYIFDFNNSEHYIVYISQY